MLVMPGSIGLLLLALPLCAQQAPVFRTETTLALVRFHVMRKHSYVDDLKPEDVILLEDGSPRRVAVFEGGRLTPRTIPIQMTLLFDTSGSVTSAGLLDPLAYQATLLDNLENVRLAVYSFTSTLRRQCRPTRDPSELAMALRRVADSRPGPQVESIPLQLPPGRKGGPATWLFEAIMAAAKDSAAEPGQATRMLVVFSDGFPTTNTRPEEAVSMLSEFGIPIYPVVLGHADLAARKAGGQLGWPEMAEMFIRSAGHRCRGCPADPRRPGGAGPVRIRGGFSTRRIVGRATASPHSGKAPLQGSRNPRRWVPDRDTLRAVRASHPFRRRGIVS